MGGDGGTISSNRTYLRGAGKACHTADHPSNAAKRAKLEDTERARLILTTCAISGAMLDLTPSKNNNNNAINSNNNSRSCSGADIVACPYGKLYNREEALEALLRRSQQINTNGVMGKSALGSHVRGMKDLHPVRFYVTATSASSSSSSNNGDGNNNYNGNGRGTMARRYTATCPITSADIGSGNVPSFVIVRTKNAKKKNSSNDDDDDDEKEVEISPNVISERAMTEMGIDGLQTEYGPFEEMNMIRLAPPKAGGSFEEIQRKWDARVEEEQVAKLLQKKKKKDKKRKRGNNEEVKSKSAKSEPTTSLPVAAVATASKQIKKKSSVADEARSNIQMKVAHNPVLSSLFGTSGKKHQSEKEKRDALFTRNC